MKNITTQRPEQLQRLLELLTDYFQQMTICHDTFSHDAQYLSTDIFSNLATSTGVIRPTDTNLLPACQYLDSAISNIRCAPSAVVTSFADVLEELRPLLKWQHRSQANNLLGNEDQNIANCLLVGKGGMEQHDSIQIGMTIMAPNTVFTDHRHPPREVYAVLSDGSWRQNTDKWHQPGIGGFVYNQENIVHAFKSGQTPLLAIWCLSNLK